MFNCTVQKRLTNKVLLNGKRLHLELLEDNHFLRFLEHGVKIKTVEVEGWKDKRGYS